MTIAQPHSTAQICVLLDLGVTPLSWRLPASEQPSHSCYVADAVESYLHPLLRQLVTRQGHFADLMTAFTADMTGLPTTWLRQTQQDLDSLTEHACLDESQEWSAPILDVQIARALEAGLIDADHEPLFVRYIADVHWSRFVGVHSHEPPATTPTTARVALAVAICAYQALPDPTAAIDHYERLLYP